MRTLNNPFNWNTAATFPSKWHVPVHPVSLNINTLVIQFHVAQTLYGILSVTAGDNISAGYRHWQFPAIRGKVTRQFPIRLTHGISLKRFRFSGRFRCNRFSLLAFFFLTGSRFTTSLFLRTLTGTLYFFRN